MNNRSCLFYSNHNVYKFLATFNKYLIYEEENLKATLIEAFPFDSEKMNDYVSQINNSTICWEYDDLLNYANQGKAMILKIEQDLQGNTSFSYEEWDGVTYVVSNYVNGDMSYESEVEFIDR